MKSISAPHFVWSLRRFPSPPWLHSIRRYSDVPGPSSASSKVPSPTKRTPDVTRESYKVALRDGFQGTLEEFIGRRHFYAYERAVKLGRFQGTYDAWRYEIASHRTPGTCAYISTLSLDKVSQTGQSASTRLLQDRPRIRRHVLVNGQAVGQAHIYLGGKYKGPSGTLFKMYYDPEKHLLRFQTQDGQPLPEYTDIDLISKAASVGYRPLLILAHSEGLIPTVPDGYLPSLDLQTNTKSGYYIRANREATPSSPIYRSTILFPRGLGNTLLAFRLSEPEKFQYLRFFPYIHEDQTLRFWDVERGADAPLKMKKSARPWEPQYVKKRFPELFEHAKRLGYWKEF
ncbi:hypothetical protein FRC01_005507 [Tulasnella sp. 417]|nr:hypothetical protein FRC01_005507 [Tulasnella sp. 417]